MICNCKLTVPGFLYSLFAAIAFSDIKRRMYKKKRKVYKKEEKGVQKLDCCKPKQTAF
jgi:hypothetical protein